MPTVHAPILADGVVNAIAVCHFNAVPTVTCPLFADGVVNAIGHDYIGVLVLGIFNAAIGRAQIPAHIQCRPLVRRVRCMKQLAQHGSVFRQ